MLVRAIAATESLLFNSRGALCQAFQCDWNLRLVSGSAASSSTSIQNLPSSSYSNRALTVREDAGNMSGYKDMVRDPQNAGMLKPTAAPSIDRGSEVASVSQVRSTACLSGVS